MTHKELARELGAADGETSSAPHIASNPAPVATVPLADLPPRSQRDTSLNSHKRSWNVNLPLPWPPSATDVVTHDAAEKPTNSLL